MLAEVKLLMEDKISGDREKGEETPTTKTKCVPLRGSCQAAKLRGQPGDASAVQRVAALPCQARRCVPRLSHASADPAFVAACSKRRTATSRASATRTRRWRRRSPSESAQP